MRSNAKIELLVAAVAMSFLASPAFAGVPPVPAPVAGAGIVALAALAMGYRALKIRLRK